MRLKKILVSKAAKKFGWSRSRLYQYIQKERLKVYEEGGVKFVDEDEVAQLREATRIRREIWEEAKDREKETEMLAPAA